MIEQSIVHEGPKSQDLFDSAPVAFHELDPNGLICRVNRTECNLLGYEPHDLLGRPIWDFVIEADREASGDAFRQQLSGEYPVEITPRRFVRRDCRELWLESHDTLLRNAAGETVGIRSALLDVTARKQSEIYRESERRILQILNQPGELRDAMESILAQLKTLTGCDGVGIRLRDGEDFPYFVQHGYSDTFLEAENSLILREADGSAARDENGNVRLDCTCGLVLSSGADPDSPLLTKGGCRWTNDSLACLNIQPAQDPCLRVRNRCIHEGYASIALVPIRCYHEVVGLIHLSDRRKSRFTLETVELLEGIASHIGETLTRKQAVAALSESEERYRSLFENSHAAMWIVDPDSGSIVDANASACRFYGWTREQIQQMSIRDINALPPEQLQAEIERARVGNRHAFFPHRLADGSLRNVEVFSGPVTFGSRSLLFSIIHDVTDRLQAEAALWQANQAIVQAERHYRAIFNSVSDAVFVHNLDDDGVAGPFLEVNDAACRYLGYTREELLQKSFLDIVDTVGLELNLDLQRLTRDLRANGEVLYERSDIAKDGRRIPVEVVTRLAGFDGSPTVISCVRDIGNRKREEKRYRDIVDGAIEGIYRTSAEGKSLASNPALARMLGYDSVQEYLSEMTDSAHQVWVDPNERAQFLKLLEGHEVVRGYECQLKRRDGTPVWVSVNSRKVCDDDGRILYNEGFIEDISERKRGEEERARLEAQFQQAQKMESVGRLAGGVAHDFNNLLTVINGYSQMLLANLSANDPARAELAEIHKAGERAAALTRQLLAFSRKQVLEPRRLDVNRVVEEIRPMLERLMGEDIEVRVALDAESGTVYADPHQLQQVLMNLAVNSRDAMPRGGKLLIETACVERDERHAQAHPEARASRYVMLAVTDSGVGMDEETRKRIFEPFFTTKGAGAGTGLGLSMVQGVVIQSGGDISVYSEPGLGATFKIYLPALAEAAADIEKPEARPVLGGKETLLVVEDQDEVRNYAVKVLKAYGYRVIPAESAGQALLLHQRECGRIALVLTDVVMPNVSGRELADRLETLQPGIKVLFMSGYTDNAIEYHQVLEQGAEFIQKPFSPEELAGRVRAMLGPAPASTPAARILVVDDEPAVRSFLRMALEQGGYQVIEAEDGKQALEQSRDVDLVITDLIMPGKEGIETIRALRRNGSGVRIIAISGAFGGQYLEVAQLMGADAVLTKPIQSALLLSRVADVLKSRS